MALALEEKHHHHSGCLMSNVKLAGQQPVQSSKLQTHHARMQKDSAHMMSMGALWQSANVTLNAMDASWCGLRCHLVEEIIQRILSLWSSELLCRRPTHDDWSLTGHCHLSMHFTNRKRGGCPMQHHMWLGLFGRLRLTGNGHISCSS